MRILVGAVGLLLAGLSPAYALPGSDEGDSLRQELEQLQAKIAQLEAKLGSESEPAANAGLDSRLDEILSQAPTNATASRLNVTAPGNDNLTMNGGFRWRATGWNNFPAAGGPDETLSLDQSLSVGFTFRVSEKTEVNLALNDARVWGTDGLSVPGAEDANLDVTTATMKVEDVYSSGVDLLMGHQQIRYGAGRYFGDDPWNMQPIRWDGITAIHVIDDRSKISFNAVRLADGDSLLATEYLPGAGGTNADVFALYFTHDSGADFGMVEAYLYFLDADLNSLGTGVAKSRFFTYGARWTHAIEDLSWDVEATTQFGRLFGVRTKDYGFDNWMLAARANYAIHDVEYLKGVVGGYDYATGGSNAFVPLTPENHGWFGLSDAATWNNVQHFMLGLDFGVVEDSDDNLQFAWHWNRLDTGNAGFGGRAIGTTVAPGDEDLGQEWNVVYSVNCTHSSKFDAGFGWFYPGEAYRNAFGTNRDVQFGYLQYGLTF